MAADKIDEGIWLGNKHTFTDPEYNVRFQAIMTVMLEMEVLENNIKEKVAGRTWLHIPLDDDYTEDISQHFLHAIQFIETARKQGQCILVHCAGGISRSSTIVCAYLMWKHNWTRKEALDYIIARRNIVNPNEGFMDQLLTFETVLQKIQP